MNFQRSIFKAGFLFSLSLLFSSEVSFADAKFSDFLCSAVPMNTLRDRSNTPNVVQAFQVSMRNSGSEQGVMSCMLQVQCFHFDERAKRILKEQTSFEYEALRAQGKLLVLKNFVSKNGAPTRASFLVCPSIKKDEQNVCPTPEECSKAGTASLMFNPGQLPLDPEQVQKAKSLQTYNDIDVFIPGK